MSGSLRSYLLAAIGVQRCEDLHKSKKHLNPFGLCGQLVCSVQNPYYTDKITAKISGFWTNFQVKKNPVSRPSSSQTHIMRPLWYVQLHHINIWKWSQNRCAITGRFSFENRSAKQSGNKKNLLKPTYQRALDADLLRISAYFPLCLHHGLI